MSHLMSQKFTSGLCSKKKSHVVIKYLITMIHHSYSVIGSLRNKHYVQTGLKISFQIYIYRFQQLSKHHSYGSIIFVNQLSIGSNDVLQVSVQFPHLCSYFILFTEHFTKSCMPSPGQEPLIRYIDADHYATSGWKTISNLARCKQGQDFISISLNLKRVSFLLKTVTVQKSILCIHSQKYVDGSERKAH